MRVGDGVMEFLFAICSVSVSMLRCGEQLGLRRRGEVESNEPVGRTVGAADDDVSISIDMLSAWKRTIGLE